MCVRERDEIAGKPLKIVSRMREKSLYPWSGDGLFVFC